MRLIVAEKPSVARDLARVLGLSGRHEGWIGDASVAVTWCVGHLVELEDPAHYDPAWKAWRMDVLPMVPERFALRAREGATDQWAVVRRLLRERGLREVINACDAGREGELIFRYVYELAGCAAPVRRFWTGSLTDEAIRAAWGRLDPASRYEPLADAARCRSEADWLVGLNATRAMTCRTREAGGDALWSVGRVQTPTLAMIVRRDREIAAFVPETFWQVKATFSAISPPPDAAAPAGAPTWQATWFRPSEEPTPRRPDARGEPAKEDDEVPHAERLRRPEDAQAIVDAVTGRVGRVVKADRQEKRERPPLLYDLTALQRRANQRYGMSAQRTLEVAQALYERHKLITYPRTDARHLTQDQVPGLPDVLRGVGQLAVYRPFTDALLARPLRITPRIVDDAEVGDHHAILPTGRAPDTTSLDPDEKRVYDLVARRLLAALSPDAVFDLTELVTAVPVDVALPEGVASPLLFRARGRVCREEGWRAVDPPGASKDHDLPRVQVGDDARCREAAAHEGHTRPPRPHDDASILHAMETAGRELDDAELARAMRSAGLGTPATRAAILQTLLDRSYVVRDGKAMRATPKGMALIDAVPVDELKSAELTGRWEKRLADIAEGRDQRSAFMRDVADHVRGMIGAIAQAPLSDAARVREREREDTTPLGRCPACGEPVRARGTVFTCDTGRSCPFVVFGTMARKKIGPRVVRELLKHGKTEVLDGFTSKEGKPFAAGLRIGEGGKVELYFPTPDEKAALARARDEKAARAEASRARRDAGEEAPKRARATARQDGPTAGRSVRRPDADGERSGRPSKASASPRARRAATDASPSRGGRSDEAADTAPPPPARSRPPPHAPPAEAPTTTRRPPTPVEGARCPRCTEGRVIRGRTAFGCSRWREGCDWRSPLP